MGDWERFFKYLTLVLVLSGLVVQPQGSFVQAGDGWDVTVSMFVMLPAPIAVPADSGESDPVRGARTATYE